MQTTKKINWKIFIGLVATLAIGMLTGVGVDIAIRPSNDNEVTLEANYSIELSEEQVPTIIETEDGNVEIIEAPTVEKIDGDQLVDECPENEDECGQGRYIYAPTETFSDFKDYVYGGCWNADGAWGAQCWDLADLFWQNYAGRNFSTCGTGAAKGAWNCKEKNAGDGFELIYDVTLVQAGDWIIFGSGQYGHVGMAMGGYNNGYVALLGQNQGGATCEGGGSAANIINISLGSFIGAFRPKSYIKPDPVPEPEPIPISGCLEWGVERGDTMSKIMLECEGTVVYGKAMNRYADSWYSRIIKPGQSVYYGWTHGPGVGLYEGDWIDHKIDE